MTDNADDKAQAVADVGTVTPTQEKTQPAKGQDWESSYKGLQKTYDKLHAEKTNVEVQLENVMGELEALKAELRKGKVDSDTLSQQLSSKDEEIQRLKSLEESATKQASRTKLILREFGDLAKFEGEGLLPSAADEEDLRAKLTRFRETMGAEVGAKVEDKVKGAGPPPVQKPEPPKLDRDDIYNQLTRLAGSFDPEDQQKYSTLMDQWLSMQSEG